MKASKLNIIIPVFNEEARILNTLQSLESFSLNIFDESIEVTVYIVDDGSTDTTLEVLTTFLASSRLNISLIKLELNQGKGAAIRNGILRSSEADYYYIADADLSASWDLIPKFMEEMRKTNCNAVIGSRAVVGSMVATKWYRKLAGRVAATFVRIGLGLEYRDTQCGYKLFDHKCKQAYELSVVNDWAIDFEILFLLKRLHLAVRELGIKWDHMNGGKVKAFDYVISFWRIWQIRFRKYTINKTEKR